MQDRLAEFHGITTRPESTHVPRINIPGTRVGVPEQIQNYYQEIEELKISILRLELLVANIENKYNESLLCIDSSMADKLVLEMGGLMVDTNKGSQIVAKSIKQLAVKNKIAQLQCTNAEHRIREQSFAVVAKKFYEIMTEYQGLKSKSSTKYRERIQYQLELASGQKPTNEQVDAVIEGGDSNRIFGQQLLQEKRNQDAANTLVYIQGRHNDIVRLESNINELYEVFQDMALLVEQQGEILNSIEGHVASSVAHQEEGVAELKKASGWAVKARKKKCLIIILIVVCVVVIGVAVAVPVALMLRK